jgi:hypothetical protein
VAQATLIEAQPKPKPEIIQTPPNFVEAPAAELQEEIVEPAPQSAPAITEVEYRWDTDTSPELYEVTDEEDSLFDEWLDSTARPPRR